MTNQLFTYDKAFELKDWRDWLEHTNDYNMGETYEVATLREGIRIMGERLDTLFIPPTVIAAPEIPDEEEATEWFYVATFYNGYEEEPYLGIYRNPDDIIYDTDFSDMVAPLVWREVTREFMKQWLDYNTPEGHEYFTFQFEKDAIQIELMQLAISEVDRE